ncbi:MAG: sigma 54-interacting transcriptional regulator [Verrucomicrobiota bacterium]|nr:sigma 54-interacting transcriptional regulator [Verrucomicrobiota bacterium]
MPESLIAACDQSFIAAVAALAHCNPFTTARLDLEKEALGINFKPTDLAWNKNPHSDDPDPNLSAIREQANTLAPALRERFAAAKRPSLEDRRLYFQFTCFRLFHNYVPDFDQIIKQNGSHLDAGPSRVRCYERFKKDAELYLAPLKPDATLPLATPDLFACLFQVRRAFLNIFTYIVGGSTPAVKLRARVWQSIFTHDMSRYQRGLYSRMNDITTLITGPSGTGKELVARAIGWSRYIPFNEGTQAFAVDSAQSFFPINLAALSPTLIESELFGHRKGAFTGALQDHSGYFETSGPHGTVFLDEIGETEHAIQVKLLRVLQTRQFQRLGDTGMRTFEGRIVAATNRDLGKAMEEGHFREDLYYRICADHLETPSLRDVLDDSPDELPFLVRHIARRLVAQEEVNRFVKEAVERISKTYGDVHAWPGNFRELEQCMRNILVHGECPPARLHGKTPNADDWLAANEHGTWTAERVLSHYCNRVYSLNNEHLENTARILELDRRTVKKYLKK